jgi:hypothetical protein
MGVDRQSPADYGSRTSEGKLSLDAEQALPSFNPTMALDQMVSISHALAAEISS